MKHARWQRLRLSVGAMMAVMLTTGYAEHQQQHMSSVFKGNVVNGGTVTHSREGGQTLLRLSEDFQIPSSPDPHWQVIDSRGKTHLLQALKVKEGLSNREIALPSYVPNVAKVQVWCAFAQVVLGEATFRKPLK